MRKLGEMGRRRKEITEGREEGIGGVRKLEEFMELGEGFREIEEEVVEMRVCEEEEEEMAVWWEGL